MIKRPSNTLETTPLLIFHKHEQPKCQTTSCQTMSSITVIMRFQEHTFTGPPSLPLELSSIVKSISDMATLSSTAISMSCLLDHRETGKAFHVTLLNDSSSSPVQVIMSEHPHNQPRILSLTWPKRTSQEDILTSMENALHSLLMRSS